MTNPILVEVLRGGLVESVHRGAVCAVDADGATVLALGDVTAPVFPRSAVKALQALPLVESGAADRYRLGEEELAIACGSHGGEPAHVTVAERMLARAGLDVAALECVAHHLGVEPRGYVAPNHPVQRAVRTAIEQLAGATLGEDRCGVDGCSVPT